MNIQKHNFGQVTLGFDDLKQYIEQSPYFVYFKN
jgi:hypothetical protein